MKNFKGKEKNMCQKVTFVIFSWNTLYKLNGMKYHAVSF